MPSSEPARTAARRTLWAIAAAVAVVSAALIGVYDVRSPGGSSSPATSAPTAKPLAARPKRTLPGKAPSAPAQRPSADDAGPAGEADGVVPDGVTVFDSEYAAVAKLNPALLSALRQAATDARRDGLTFNVNSGWRSPRYQQQLLDEAISKYGSEQAAARWVATPSTSAHVTGDAIDIGPAGTDTWLSRHGAAYGLCQIYRNEAWHYELRPEAIQDGCPPMYTDAAHDPRMQQ